MNPNQLPIFKHRQEIIDLVNENQVVIVVGETGSGKTTQVPTFFYDIPKYTTDVTTGEKTMVIGITEPRRIAAASTAAFVAKQLKVELGREVAYQVRFDSQRSDDTDMSFMTTGILLREMQSDPYLSQYSIIMVDEAHERSIDTDILLGWLKQILPDSPSLRVIVASATIDSKKFSDFFDGAPIVNVSGRTFPVKIHYDDRDYSPEPTVIHNPGKTTVVPPEYIERIGTIVHQICSGKRLGDVLVFLPGYREIEWAREAIEKRIHRGIKIFRLHGDTTLEEQLEALDDCPERKVILATNIAETSITPDGVVFVIDSGFVKQNEIDQYRGVTALKVVKHSQAGSNQRTGRAGRTAPGECYRLFTSEDFHERLRFTVPEIQRTKIENTILHILSLAVTEIEEFPFLDPPSYDQIREAIATLRRLGAITPENELTDVGKKMAYLPIDVHHSKMILAAAKLGCTEEAITLAAFLSTRSVFWLPKEESERPKAERQWEKVKDHRSDFLTYLKIWDMWTAAGEESENGSRGNWAFEHFLNNQVLVEVMKIRKQLVEMLETCDIEIMSNREADVIHKCVLAGFSDNLMKASMRFTYSHIQAGMVFRHPGSVMFNSDEELLVAATVTKKGLQQSGCQKTYMDHVAPVRPLWLLEMCPEVTKLDPEWDTLQFDWHSREFRLWSDIRFRNYWEFRLPPLPIKASDLNSPALRQLAMGSMKKTLTNITATRLMQAREESWETKEVRSMAIEFVEKTTHEFETVNNLTNFVERLDDFIAEFMSAEETFIAEKRTATARARFEHEEALKREIEVECQKLRDKITPETRILLEQYLPEDYRWQSWFPTSLLIDKDLGYFLSSGDSVEMVAEKVKRATGTLPALIALAERERAKWEQRRAIEEKHAQLLAAHLEADYQLCPVCNEMIDLKKAQCGEFSCRCGEEEFQEQFRFKGEKVIPIIQSLVNGSVILELRVIRSADNVYRPEILNCMIQLGDQHQIAVRYYEAPTDEDKRQRQLEAERALMMKTYDKAEREIRKNEALKLSFTRGRDGQNRERWESPNGKYIYIVDRNATTQPQMPGQTFYCRRKGTMGRQGSYELVLVEPYLERL